MVLPFELVVEQLLEGLVVIHQLDEAVDLGFELLKGNELDIFGFLYEVNFLDLYELLDLTDIL